MRRASLIGHVCELYASCVASRGPADSIVRTFFRERRYLGASDRRFIGENVYAMIRASLLLDHYLAQVGPLPLAVPSEIVPYAMYAIRVLRQPDHMVEEDLLSVVGPGIAAREVREVLAAVSALQSPEDSGEDPVRRLAVVRSFPEFIVREWVGALGMEGATRLCEALNQPAPTTIRVNTLRISVEECRERLVREGIVPKPARHSPHALTLPQRLHLPSLSVFREGLVELQDEGSQMIAFLLAPEPGEIIVDACAGGGGKSLHMAVLMKNTGTIHAFESHERRFGDLQQRCTRGRLSIILPRIVNEDVLSGLHQQVDAVLIDAPCSGSGTMRRNPSLRRTITTETVEAYVFRQQEVLEGYSPLVRPGGRLVYATCSLLRKENEEVIGWFLQKHPEFHAASAVAALERSGISIEDHGTFLYLFPHETDSDGFFAALLVRDR